jgi:AhpD family alkylhydroperoxidase
MKARLEHTKVAPAAFRAVFALEKYVRESGLEHSLLHLIKIRASQINGCAYCIDMHWKDARAEGEREDRLYMLNAWRESDLYSPRERAALALTEAVTLVAETQVPDAVYEEAGKHFSEAELVNVTLAISTINTWNRISITFRAVPGVYQPGQYAKAV